jgi:outer membrane lipoprotein
MKNPYLTIFICLLLFSCAPVLRHDFLNQGTYDVRLSEIRQNPALNKGRLFILGGIIVNTTITKEGSLIEAVYVPVTSRGHLKKLKASNGRFLALYRGKELLDPVIYEEKREITIAGEFVETRKGKIGETEYDYPLFEIKEIYLWEEIRKKGYYYYIPPPFPPYLPYPHWNYPHRYYDPWWGYY